MCSYHWSWSVHQEIISPSSLCLDPDDDDDDDDDDDGDGDDDDDDIDVDDDDDGVVDLMVILTIGDY